MADTLAVGIAFGSGGALASGAGVLLLLNPRSRNVRWFVGFQLNLAAWLFASGWVQLGPGGAAEAAQSAAAYLLPGVFLGSAAVVGGKRPALMAPLAPVVVALSRAGASLVGSGPGALLDGAVQLVAWTLGGALIWRGRIPGLRRGIRRHVFIALSAIAPVIGAVAVFGGSFADRYILPLLVLAALAMVFGAVVRYRLYEIEVRIARSGDLAVAAAAEDRLALLGELAATFAHEVRNPLTGVRSLAQRLGEEEVDGERRRKYASVIVAEVGRVERLVEQALGLARRPGVAPSTAGPTDVAELLGDVLLLLEGRAARASVSFDTDARSVVARVPREGLAQILLNLGLNAVAHSPPGGRVAIRAYCADAVLRMTVRDEGPGIPTAERERVFAPLVSGVGSTGLGLTVTRRIARELGGDVTIHDAPGGGAELRVELPA